MAYSPEIGTWMQEDPAGYVDGADTYQFLLSNPIQSVDPTGRDDWNGFFGIYQGDINQMAADAWASQQNPPPTTCPTSQAPPPDPDYTIVDAFEYLTIDGKYNPLPLLEHDVVGAVANVFAEAGAAVADFATLPVRRFTHEMDNDELCVVQVQRAFDSWYSHAWENFLHGPDKSHDKNSK